MSEKNHDMWKCAKKTRIFLGLWHWIVPIQCIQLTPIYYHHSIQSEFDVINWLLHVMYNHNVTTRLVRTNWSWISLGVCWHSDTLKWCMHVVGEMQIYILQEFISLDENPQLMNPSWKLFPCINVFRYNCICRSLTQLTLFNFIERAYRFTEQGDMCWYTWNCMVGITFELCCSDSLLGRSIHVKYTPQCKTHFQCGDIYFKMNINTLLPFPCHVLFVTYAYHLAWQYF